MRRPRASFFQPRERCKMSPDDPKVTAYALNELSEEERRAVEKSLRDSPELDAVVREIHAVADELGAAFKAELHLTTEEPHNVLPMPYGRLFWSERRWPALAMVAALILVFCVIAGLLWRGGSSPTLAISNQPDLPEITVEDESPASSGPEQSPGERPFVSATTQRITRLPLRLGTGSFARVRNYIAAGVRPPTNEVRIEELVNAFTYTYPEPQDDRIVTAVADAAPCPWNPEHLLARVGIKFRNAATAAQLASEGIGEVEFNPARVQSYRLIGFEEPSRGTPSRENGGEKESLTALYEIAMRQDEPASRTGGYVAKVRVRNRSAELTESAITTAAPHFDDATSDFRFAAAIGAFGMILRDSTYKGSASLEAVIQWASDAKGSDPHGERSAFIDLARRTQQLM